MKSLLLPDPPRGAELLTVIEGITMLDRDMATLPSLPAWLSSARQSVDLLALIQKVAAGGFERKEMNADELTVLTLVAIVGLRRHGASPAEIQFAIDEAASATVANSAMRKAAGEPS